MNILDLINATDVGRPLLERDNGVTNQVDEYMASDAVNLLSDLCNKHFDKSADLLLSIGIDLLDIGNITEVDVLKSSLEIDGLQGFDGVGKINITAAMLSKQLSLGETSGFECVRMWVFYKMKSNQIMADFMMKQVAAHVLYSYGSEFIPRIIGSKGGRKVHPHRDESMLIAKNIWEVMPEAKIGDVIKSVSSKIKAKYQEVPSDSTLKNWLKDAEFRPIESRR